MSATGEHVDADAGVDLTDEQARELGHALLRGAEEHDRRPAEVSDSDD